jgi:hypothetical protein
LVEYPFYLSVGQPVLARVQGKNEVGWSEAIPSKVLIMPDPSCLPTTLYASSYDPYSITLEWTKVATAQSYDLYWDGGQGEMVSFMQGT